jgi:uracil-DNA glycosylase family protein
MLAPLGYGFLVAQKLFETDGTAAPLIPERPTLKKLKEAAAGCTACPLHETGTQTVFGEGLTKAEIILVGEQPGDQEDLAGKPFVGPAGRLLDKALEEAGIDRKLAYVTNTVKHFRFEQRGKRRIHQRPGSEHIKACRPWLDAELDLIKPRVLVCLGAVAAQALLGSKVRVTKDRGKPLESDLAPVVLVTIHPSSILRERDEEARAAAFEGFVADLRVVAQELTRA